MSRAYHPRVDRNNPDAWGVCDRCQQTVVYKTMRREMVQTGNTLTWNGLLICSRQRCLDKPHPQSRIRKAMIDPIPVKNSRSGDRLTPMLSTWVSIRTQAGTAVLPVVSTSGFVATDAVTILLDNNQLHKTTVSTVGASSLTLNAVLPFRVGAGEIVLNTTRSG